MEPAVAILVLATCFLLPVLATGWAWLFVATALALLPALGFALYGSTVSDRMEQGFAYAFAVIAAAPALAGFLARTLSLRARARGHGRPASLWIEAAFALAGIGFAAFLIGF